MSSADIYAQDKNLLAKVAYENAENFFGAGNISEAYDELKKVDELLGKLTPKSQFLRVQIWKAYADRNAENIVHALNNCERYLELSKTYDLPEEKQVEVIRLQQQLEKDQLAWNKLQKEKKETAERQAQAFKEWNFTDWPLGISLDELKALKAGTGFFNKASSSTTRFEGITEIEKKTSSYISWTGTMGGLIDKTGVYGVYLDKENKVVGYKGTFKVDNSKSGYMGYEAANKYVQELASSLTKKFGITPKAYSTNSKEDAKYWSYRCPGNKGTFTWATKQKLVEMEYITLIERNSLTSCINFNVLFLQ